MNKVSFIGGKKGKLDQPYNFSSISVRSIQVHYSLQAASHVKNGGKISKYLCD